MKNKIKYIAIALFLSQSLFSWAQEEINHNVVVIKSYSPVIGDANKLSEQPNILDSVEPKPNFKYSILSSPFFTQYSPKSIKAVKMVGEPLKKLYQNYALIGFGNYAKPMFEYRYASQRSKTLLTGINLSHLSQHGNLKLEGLDEKVYSGYSHNKANIFLHRIFKKSALETDLTYNRHALHYYGRNAFTDTTIQKEDSKQYFSWMNATMRYKTTRLDSSHINYNVFLDYNYFEDYHNTFLNDINVGGVLGLFLDKELIGLDFSIHHYNHLTPEVLYSNTISHFHPRISKSNEHWGIEAGLSFDVDANNDSTLFHYYPRIKLYYNVIDYFLVPYLGISGGKESNNYRKIALENPFVKPGLIVKNTNSLIVLYGGIRGNFTENLSYNIKGTYSIIDDAYFYTNDSTNRSENQFIVEYDDIERYDIDAELNWKKSKKLNFMLLGKYHGFKMNRLEYAWHVPDYEFIFSTNYNLKSKIIVNFDMFVKGQRYTKTYYFASATASNTYMVEKIPETFDLSLGIEYRYTKKLSAFLRMNNLLARKNYLWNYYPTEGFNAMLGVIYSF